MKAVTSIFLLALLILELSGRVQGAEPVKIDPAKVAQLQRLEPLTADKVDVFVESGQLSKVQADYVKKHIGANGLLALPAAAIGTEIAVADIQPPAAAVRPTAPAEPATPPAAATHKAPTSLYADFDYKLKPSELEKIDKLLSDYRHGSRPEIGVQLRQFRPQVNALIAAAYTDNIDLPIKIALWKEVAGPANPDAAIGLFETHRALYDLARPVLIPYEKDAGGLLVRRLTRHPDAGEQPRERWLSSRDLREEILEVEGMIAFCPSVSSAIFLMDVYSQRYTKGEAPMRDKNRDRHRLVEACGANKKKFDEDESGSWKSILSQHNRAIIAERLIPWIHHGDDDRKQIARNGLMICIPKHHPGWDKGAATWEAWWAKNKDLLLSEK